ncbi:mechanosensitive ion channel family protein [Clostridium sp. DL1XJH146]
MEEFLEIIVTSRYSLKIVWSLMCLVIVIVIARLLKNILYKSIDDNNKYYLVKQRINYIIGFIIIIINVFIWADDSKNLTTYIGLLSAGIAIALKELITNISGWLFIEVRRPFDVGHRILIGEQKGDVIDKRLFQFTLMEVSSAESGEQSTGRIIDVPNSFVFVHPLTNYTKGFEYIWNEISVLLTFESDWELAKKLLREIVDKDTKVITSEVAKQLKDATKKYMIHYKNLTPIVYTDVKESGIQMTIRYLCAPKHRRGTTNNIWEDILKMVDTHENIDLAYPTKRVIN